jgi:hypothetical protein
LRPGSTARCLVIEDTRPQLRAGVHRFANEHPTI